MYQHSVFNVFLLSIFLLFSNAVSAHLSNTSHVSASGDNVLLNHGQVQSLGSDLYYLEDESDAYALEQVMTFGDQVWTKSEVATPNFGYTDSSYWFRVSITSADTDIEKLIVIEYALLDYIEFYVLENNQIKQLFITGDTFPFSQRPIRHRDFLFPVHFQADHPLTFLIKVKTQGSLQVPINIWDEDKFVWQDQEEQLIKAIYYGMMLVLVLYNLFLFVFIRERSYLYYGGLVVSVLVLMSGIYGYLYQYVYPNTPSLQKVSILLAVPCVMLFTGLFSSYFLSLSKIAPRLNKAVNFFNVLFFLSILGAFFLPYDISTRSSVFLAIPSSLVIMYAGPYAWYKGQDSARYFTYAWAFLVTGIIVAASSKFGILPRNNFTEHALSFGSAIEALLLSFALADRFNKERQDKIRAQQAQIEEERHRKTAEKNLYKQATHENLDGFPNTVLFQQSLYKMLYEDKADHQFCLYYFHLGGIQEINKTLGHAHADIILGLFSKRLLRIKMHSNAALIEQSGTNKYYFAHIEKGLFAHLLTDIELNASVEFANELMKTLSEPIEYKGMKLDLGLSIGIACCPIHGMDIETLTRHARVAIDGADHSNGRVGVYSSEINPYSERRLVLMGELKKAIDLDTLALHYQPIISCQTGDVVGAEALLRWNHESMGFIPPDEFILSAERTGIMRYLTRWVLERALKDYAHRRKIFGPSSISVNVSAVNIHEKDFEEAVLQLLNVYNIPASELIIEVTETAVMKDPEYAISALIRLSNHSIKLAIDDFGTGYSSLTYIQKLPIYEIKIDRSFIQHMDTVEGDEVIVKTTLNMAKDLGCTVVAEGIENQAALESLRLMGCDFAQGYLIAKPMSLESFIAWQQARKNDESFTELKSS